MSDHQLYPLTPAQANILLPRWREFVLAQERATEIVGLILSGAGIENATVSGPVQTAEGWAIQFEKKAAADGPRLVASDEK